MLPFFEVLNKVFKKFTDKTGVRFEPWPIFIVGLVLLIVSFMFMPEGVSEALSMALFLAPVWLPFLLIGGAVTLWIVFKRSEFISTRKTVLLEIKPPRNVVRTPLAMEAFLSGIHLGSDGSWYLQYAKGSVRPWWSLEIASFEGQIHFYIWTQVVYRRIVEAQLYAQYPGVQIVETPDYTRFISAEHGEWSVWGCDFTHTKEDPLPLKTYVEYGLDKVQKEPEQVDPLANVLEFLGSIGKGEHIWLQFIIRVHKGEKYNKGKDYDWKEKGNELIEEIREKTRDSYKDSVTGEERPGFPNPTKGQMERIAAIERNTSKLAFDVGARAVYIVKEGGFNLSAVFGIIGLFKTFNSEGWNGMKITGWLSEFNDYPWEILAEKLKIKVRRALIEAYRRRQFFHDPFTFGMLKEKTMVMSTEELATVYHIPSGAIGTPTLGRIQSATGEAPSNLPT